jgi:hypothetical protein
MRAVTEGLQAELAALSPNGRRVIVRESGHYAGYLFYRHRSALSIRALVGLVRRPDDRAHNVFDRQRGAGYNTCQALTKCLARPR